MDLENGTTKNKGEYQYFDENKQQNNYSLYISRSSILYIIRYRPSCSRDT